MLMHSRFLDFESIAMSEKALNLAGEWLDIHHSAKAAERRKMIKDLKIAPGGSILDAGCGRGNFSELLYHELSPKLLVCLDLDEAHLERTRTRLTSNSGIEYVVGDVRTLLMQQRFDLVWSANVLEYLPDPNKGLTSLAGVVKPGGILAVKDEDASRDIFLNWPADIESSVAAAWKAICSDMVGTWNSSLGRELPERIIELGIGDLTVNTYLIERFGGADPELTDYVSGAFLKYKEEFSKRLSKQDFHRFVAYLTPGGVGNLFDRPHFHFIGMETVCTIRVH